MIEITVQEMLDSVSILKEINEKKMPAKAAYQFARIIRETEKELQNFQETRNNLIERFGKKDETGKLIEDKDGNIEIFQEKREIFKKEFNELMESKIHINCEKIELEDIFENEFSPAEINQLLPFVEEKKATH